MKRYFSEEDSPKYYKARKAAKAFANEVGGRVGDDGTYVYLDGKSDDYAIEAGNVAAEYDLDFARASNWVHFGESSVSRKRRASLRSVKAGKRASMREGLYTRGDFEGGTLAGNYDDYDSYSDDDYDDTDVEFEREIAAYPFASAHNGYELSDRFVEELESHSVSKLSIASISRINRPLYGDKNGFEFILYNEVETLMAPFKKLIHIEYDLNKGVVVVYWNNTASTEPNKIYITRDESWDEFVDELKKSVFPTTFRESRRRFNSKRLKEDLESTDGYNWSNCKDFGTLAEAVLTVLAWYNDEDVDELFENFDEYIQERLDKIIDQYKSKGAAINALTVRYLENILSDFSTEREFVKIANDWENNADSFSLSTYKDILDDFLKPVRDEIAAKIKKDKYDRDFALGASDKFDSHWV